MFHRGRGGGVGSGGPWEKGAKFEGHLVRVMGVLEGGDQGRQSEESKGGTGRARGRFVEEGVGVVLVAATRGGKGWHSRGFERLVKVLKGVGRKGLRVDGPAGRILERVLLMAGRMTPRGGEGEGEWGR